MYIFLTIFFVYVMTFLFKKDSKLLGDYDYFTRNNIFGLNNNLPSKESDYSENSDYVNNSEDSDYVNDSEDSDYVNDSEDNEINTEDEYDKISENEYKND
jgi:hypothetical protein